MNQKVINSNKTDHFLVCVIYTRGEEVNTFQRVENRTGYGALEKVFLQRSQRWLPDLNFLSPDTGHGGAIGK